jgi:drug/metabolite transporter (DMT)-like permease
VDLDVSYATTLVAALLLGTGFVLQQYAAEQEPDSRFLGVRIIVDLIRKPRWLLGIICMIGGYVLSAWSIGHLELTLVEPLLSTYLVFALVLAVPLSKQRLKWTEAVGALVLLSGVTLLSVSRSVTPVGGELAFGSPSNWPLAALIAGLAFVVVRAGSRWKGGPRATLTGLGAGLIFGVQDALTRQTLEILLGQSPTVLFTSWALYALVGAGIIGVWLMQNAFSAAPLRASLPAIAAGEPVAGIVLGILVFGDRIQIGPGMLAIEATGIAALIVGVIMVARSSAFGGLRRITEVIKPGQEHEPDQSGGADDDGAVTGPDRTAAAHGDGDQVKAKDSPLPPQPTSPLGLPLKPSPDGPGPPRTPSPDGLRAPRIPIPGVRAFRARRIQRPAPGSEGG